MFRLALIPVLALAAAAVSQPDSCTAPRPVAIRWNEAALRAIRAARTPPRGAARNSAVLHVALYDAVAAADPASRPCFVRFSAAVAADPEVAAAVAAHRTLMELYPDRHDDLDSILDETVGSRAAGPKADAGVAVGQAVA